MSQNDDQNIECPLCMEPFEMDDFNFFPCTCGYQICRFCWHRIRTDENGLCPACRKQYPEDPADFKPLSVEEWQKIKTEKRQKDQQKKQKMSESRKHLDNVRVVQKNLVFVVGLPARLAEAETLKKHDYFGKFGKIHKVVVNQSTSYAGSQGPSASAYVTYCRPEDALRAIGSVNNIQVDGRTLKASLGTTKYCSHFLKNQLCPKTDCMYLHELGDEAASFTKEDMQHGKHQEYEKKLQDQILGSNNNTNSNIINNINTNTKKQPAPQTPPQISPNSVKDSWPCTVQNAKESRTSRSKENSQSQKTDGKSSRSKNKHTTEGQKSKKSKVKSSETVQNSNNVSKSSTKEENSSIQKKTQKGKYKDSTSSQSSVHSSAQRIEGLQPNSGSIKLTEVIEMNHKNAQQTTFVHITEQPIQSKPVSASIKIARSESPVLPPSPISSSSSSLFTPFGSLSSNFLSSSSPSPPPSNNNPLTFSTLGGSTNVAEQGSPVNSFAAPAGLEQKQEPQSPNPMFGNIESSDSLFSHMNYIPVTNDCGSYNGHMHSEEQPITDNSDWGSSYSFGDSQKQMPEDDLDFDPWNESSKGLADLMAKEAVHHSTYTDLPTPPGFFQPIKAPVPNQQRIGVPPPGFSSRQVPHSNSLNHLPGMFGPSNADYLSNKLSAFRDQQQRQTLNGCTQQHYYPENSSTPLGLSNQYKQQQQQQQFPQPNSREIIESLRLKKNLDDRFRTLFPDMLYHLNSRNLQKTQTQNNVGPTWNQQQQTQRDISWLCNDSPMLNSGNITEGHRGSPQLWMKALQHLQIEENTSQFNVHTPYTNSFALRGQWPAAQCPPPGFAPSRSPASTPFQHMQVNQKI